MIIGRHLAIASATALAAALATVAHAQTPAPPPAAPAPPAVTEVHVLEPDVATIRHLKDSLTALGLSRKEVALRLAKHLSTTMIHVGDSNGTDVVVNGTTAVVNSNHMVVTSQSGAGAKQVMSSNSVRELIDRVRHDPDATIPLPPADSFIAGGLTIAAGQHQTGTVATVNGPLDISGTVDGNAIAIGGDIVLHPGAHVRGSAFADNGVVRMDGAGGQVDGEIRSIEGSVGNGFARVAASEAAHDSRWHAVRIAVAAFGLVLMLSIGVLTFAEEQLDNVTATLADHFGRSAWYGFVAEIALLPALLAIIVALAITIIGVVAIPFAIIGFVVLAVGAAALGFMAVAEASGTSILRSGSQASLTARGAQLRAIVTGISIFGGLWVLTAIVGADFMLGTIIRAIVLILTAVAVTVGFGAVVLWRLEMRRAGQTAKRAIAELPATDAVWQTPTPVAGVAAARRPTPAGAASGVPASPQMPSSPPAASRSAE
jgi:MFS family permease